ncbi:hypothetical protein [Streptomyces sp. SM12]|uniref:hypothetical protein n=1 Tax=Streptomyces sp. SM12 TaxID=1071602 RepID=UPI000CD5C4F5|nr:hypothetical protein [Streptomyces sp. SM12]
MTDHPALAYSPPRRLRDMHQTKPSAALTGVPRPAEGERPAIRFDRHGPAEFAHGHLMIRLTSRPFFDGTDDCVEIIAQAYIPVLGVAGQTVTAQAVRAGNASPAASPEPRVMFPPTAVSTTIGDPELETLRWEVLYRAGEIAERVLPLLGEVAALQAE